jgi:ribosomal protein S18 acetylase RimI-like enzyme
MTGGTPWLIRPLRQDDLPLYRPVRLEALRLHPEAFGSSFEEEQGDDLSRMIGKAPSVTLGGFAEDRMIGTAALLVSPKLKQRHKGHVVGVYVVPSWRGSGLAQALLDRLIVHARANSLVLLTLAVTAGNAAASRLYLRSGFTLYGVEPLSLRIGSDLLDEELLALRL